MGWSSEYRLDLGAGSYPAPCTPADPYSSFFSSFSYIQGKVIDARTGDPLPGVLLRIRNRGTYSSEKGAFQLPFEAPETLTVFFPEYRILKVFLDCLRNTLGNRNRSYANYGRRGTSYSSGEKEMPLLPMFLGLLLYIRKVAYSPNPKKKANQLASKGTAISPSSIVVGLS